MASPAPSAAPSVVPLLARRFLLSKSSDGFISLIAWVSVVGVALGVLALTLVTSVINGFEGELQRVITGMNGDVLLYSRADPLRDAPVIEDRIRKAVPDARAITRSFVAEVMVSGPEGVAGAVIEGVDLTTLGEVTEIPRRLVSGRMPAAEGEVAVGSAIADRIGAHEGAEVRLIVPFAGAGGAPGGPTSVDKADAGEPLAINARVVGIVKMGMYEYDSKFVFASLGSIQAALKQPDRVTSFKIRLRDGADSAAASERLTETFGFPFRSKDWAQLNRNLFYAIKLEKVVISILLTAIVIVAAFNVVSTLMMMIHDKGREIAILKAMGFRPSQSFALFCLIGVGMGIVGTAGGVALGLGLGQVLEKTRLIRLPPDIYYIGFLPVVIHWRELALIAGLAIFISFAATLYPGWKVSRRSPLEGLRYD